MSKMGQEFEKRLDNAKYDLYYACLELMELTHDLGIGDELNPQVEATKRNARQIIARIEGK